MKLTALLAPTLRKERARDGRMSPLREAIR